VLLPPLFRDEKDKRRRRRSRCTKPKDAQAGVHCAFKSTRGEATWTGSTASCAWDGPYCTSHFCVLLPPAAFTHNTPARKKEKRCACTCPCICICRCNLHSAHWAVAVVLGCMGCNPQHYQKVVWNTKPEKDKSSFCGCVVLVEEEGGSGGGSGGSRYWMKIGT
jgi:hypothetical protein